MGIKMFFSFLCCVCLSFGAVAAQEREEVTVWKVGYFENSNVVKNLDSIENKGFGYDILLASEEYSEIRFEFVLVTEETLDMSLQAGVIDFFGGVSWSEERAVSYAFSEPFGLMQILLVAEEDSSIYYNDVESMEGQAISMLEGIAHLEYLETYVTTHHITTEFVEHSSLAPFMLSDTPLHLVTDFMELHDKKVVAHLGAEEIYFIALPEQEEKIQELNQVLRRLEETEPWIRYETYQKYFHESYLAKPVLTVEEMELLGNLGTLTVGYETNLYSLQGMDAKGNPEGLMVEILDYIAEEAGLTINYVPFTLGQPVNYSYFDLSIALAEDEKYLQAFTMSEEITGSPPLTLVARKGLSNPRNEVNSIGMLPYCTFDFDDIYRKYPNSEIIVYYSYDDMVTDLRSGVISSCLVSSVAGGHLLQDLGDLYYDSYHTGLILPLRLFVSNDMGKEYVDIFNTLLAQLDEGQVEKWIFSHVARIYKAPTTQEVILKFWYIYVIILLFVVMLLRTVKMTKEKKKQEEFLAFVSEDEVTGLWTEVKFLHEVKAVLKKAKGSQYRLIAVDVDQFSLVNRQYGTDSGNLILKRMAHSLSVSFPEKTMLCRSKDDLFYLFTPCLSDLRAMCGKAFCDECLVHSASKALSVDYPLSISRGTYMIEDPSIPLETMLLAVNRARMLGKNSYGMTTFAYTDALNQQQKVVEDLLSSVDSALEERALRVNYQVKVDLKTGQIIGAEALVRWFLLDEEKNPVGIRCLPEEFVPLFEEHGLISKLDYYVFQEVCTFIEKNKGNPYFPQISMNLSSSTLLRADLRSTLNRTLQSYRLEPSVLELEVAERAFTEYPQESVLRVKELREWGFTVDVDDFGSGTSSLSHLKDMDIRSLKLDKIFLDNQLNQSKGSIIVGNIIGMAKKIGVVVIAEGVETQGQLEALRQLECDQVQGFYFSNPVGESEFLEICREKKCLSREKREFLLSTNRYYDPKNLLPLWSGEELLF